MAGSKGPDEAATATASPTAEAGLRDHGRRKASDQEPAADQTTTRQEMTPLLAVKLQTYSNTRYHEDRQAFFESANRWANFATIMLGSGAAATALSTHPHIAVGCGILTAVAGSFQLVFDLAGKARTHLELRKSFAKLMAEAAKPGADPDSIEARMVAVYEGEPEIYHAVNALAYNAAQLAYGRGQNTTVKVSMWQKLARHIWHFDPSDFHDAVPE